MMSDGEDQDLVLRVTLDGKYRFLIITKKNCSIKQLKSEINKVARLVLSRDVREVTSVKNCDGFELPEIYAVGRVLQEQDEVLSYTNRHIPTLKTIVSTTEGQKVNQRPPSYLQNNTTNNQENPDSRSSDKTTQQEKTTQPLLQTMNHENNDNDDDNHLPKKSTAQKGADFTVERPHDCELFFEKQSELIVSIQALDSQTIQKQSTFTVDCESYQKLLVEDCQFERCEKNCIEYPKHLGTESELVANSSSEDGGVTLMHDCQNVAAVNENCSTGQNAVAMDDNCSASQNAIAMDANGSASQNAIAMDANCSAGQNAIAIAMDDNCSASQNDIAMDDICSAGQNAIAMNANCSAGQNAIAMDNNCSAGQNAIAMNANCSTGQNAIAMNYNSVAGQNAIAMDANCSTGQNAIAVDDNCSAGQNAIAVDANCSAGQNAIAMNYNSVACQNTIEVKDVFPLDKATEIYDNMTNHENFSDTRLARKSSHKENIEVVTDTCKDKDEVFQENSTMKRLTKQMGKHKLRKPSRTQSIDESLPEDEKNGSSNNSQQSSSISELIFNSPKFVSMLKTKEFRRRRKSLEKSVNKVASWLVESEAGSDLDDLHNDVDITGSSSCLVLKEPKSSSCTIGVEDSHNNLSTINDEEDIVDKPAKCYCVVDVTTDKVIYWDNDPDDASFSRGVLKESNLLSCTLALPYCCTEGTAAQIISVNRKRRGSEEHTGKSCVGADLSNANELPGRCGTRLLTRRGNPAHEDINDCDKSCVSTEILDNNADDDDDSHVNDDDDDNSKTPLGQKSSQQCTQSSNQSSELEKQGSVHNQTVEKTSIQSPHRQSPRLCRDRASNRRGIPDSTTEQTKLHNHQSKRTVEYPSETQVNRDRNSRIIVEHSDTASGQNELNTNKNYEQSVPANSNTSQINKDVTTIILSSQPSTADTTENDLHKDSQESQSTSEKELDIAMGSSTESEFEKEHLTQFDRNVAKKLTFESMSESEDARLSQNSKTQSKSGDKKMKGKTLPMTSVDSSSESDSDDTTDSDREKKQPKKFTSQNKARLLSNKKVVQQKNLSAKSHPSKGLDSDTSSSDSEQEKAESATVKKRVRFAGTNKEDGSKSTTIEAGPIDKAASKAVSDSDSLLDSDEDNTLKPASKTSNIQEKERSNTTNTITKKPDKSVTSSKVTSVKSVSKSDSDSDSDSDSSQENKQQKKGSKTLVNTSKKKEKSAQQNKETSVKNTKSDSESDSDSDSSQENKQQKKGSKTLVNISKNEEKSAQQNKETSVKKTKSDSESDSDSDSSQENKQQKESKTLNNTSKKKEKSAQQNKETNVKNTKSDSDSDSDSDSSQENKQQKESKTLNNTSKKKEKSAQQNKETNVKNTKSDSDPDSDSDSSQENKQQKGSKTQNNTSKKKEKSAQQNKETNVKNTKSDSDSDSDSDSSQENKQQKVGTTSDSKQLGDDSKKLCSKGSGMSKHTPKQDPVKGNAKAKQEPTSPLSDSDYLQTTDSEEEIQPSNSKQKSTVKNTPNRKPKSQGLSTCKGKKVISKEIISDSFTSDSESEGKKAKEPNVVHAGTEQGNASKGKKDKALPPKGQESNTPPSDEQQDKSLPSEGQKDKESPSKQLKDKAHPSSRSRSKAEGLIIDVNQLCSSPSKRQKKNKDQDQSSTKSNDSNYSNDARQSEKEPNLSLLAKEADANLVFQKETEGGHQKNKTIEEYEITHNQTPKKKQRLDDSSKATGKTEVENSKRDQTTDHNSQTVKLGSKKTYEKKSSKLRTQNSSDKLVPENFPMDENLEGNAKKNKSDVTVDVMSSRKSDRNPTQEDDESSKKKKKKDKHKHDMTKDKSKKKQKKLDKLDNPGLGLEKSTANNSNITEPKTKKKKKHKKNSGEKDLATERTESQDKAKGSLTRRKDSGIESDNDSTPLQKQSPSTTTENKTAKHLETSKSKKKKAQTYPEVTPFLEESTEHISRLSFKKKKTQHKSNESVVDDPSPQQPSQQPEGSVNMFSSDSEGEPKQKETIDSLLSWIEKKTAPPKNKKRKRSLLELIDDEDKTLKTPSNRSFSTQAASKFHLSSRRSFHKTPAGFTNTLPRTKKKLNHRLLPLSYTKRKRRLSGHMTSQARELTPKEKEIVSGGVNELDNLLSEDSLWNKLP